MGHASETDFSSLKIAVMTVSDTRTADNDSSGDYLQQALEEAGHELAERTIVADNIYRMREIFSRWIADPDVEVVISTGGTGLTGRDSTPEALTPLFDKTIEGFGEMFRHVSIDDVGMSTMQSRAVAGLANKTLVFCLPGSTGACKTGWNRVLKEQLDIRTRPCNFAQMFPRMDEK